mmetsp:Transcript_6402/g.19400  ORF Transcript_6402/g.19400 Transcript_6402/m.19400 type:complete len:1478 (+) Transcript_6402:755-5188(+)
MSTVKKVSPLVADEEQRVLLKWAYSCVETPGSSKPLVIATPLSEHPGEEQQTARKDRRTKERSTKSRTQQPTTKPDHDTTTTTITNTNLRRSSSSSSDEAVGEEADAPPSAAAAAAAEQDVNELAALPMRHSAPTQITDGSGPTERAERILDADVDVNADAKTDADTRAEASSARRVLAGEHESLSAALADGVLLVAVASRLQGVSVPRHNREPRHRAQRLDNLTTAKRLLHSAGSPVRHYHVSQLLDARRPAAAPLALWEAIDHVLIAQLMPRLNATHRRLRSTTASSSASASSSSSSSTSSLASSLAPSSLTTTATATTTTTTASASSVSSLSSSTTATSSSALSTASAQRASSDGMASSSPSSSSPSSPPPSLQEHCACVHEISHKQLRARISHLGRLPRRHRRLPRRLLLRHVLYMLLTTGTLSYSSSEVAIQRSEQLLRMSATHSPESNTLVMSAASSAAAAAHAGCSTPLRTSTEEAHHHHHHHHHHRTTAENASTAAHEPKAATLQGQQDPSAAVNNNPSLSSASSVVSARISTSLENTLSTTNGLCGLCPPSSSPLGRVTGAQLEVLHLSSLSAFFSDSILFVQWVYFLLPPNSSAARHRLAQNCTQAYTPEEHVHNLSLAFSALESELSVPSILNPRQVFDYGPDHDRLLAFYLTLVLLAADLEHPHPFFTVPVLDPMLSPRRGVATPRDGHSQTLTARNDQTSVKLAPPEAALTQPRMGERRAESGAVLVPQTSRARLFWKSRDKVSKKPPVGESTTTLPKPTLWRRTGSRLFKKVTPTESKSSSSSVPNVSLNLAGLRATAPAASYTSSNVEPLHLSEVHLQTAPPPGLDEIVQNSPRTRPPAATVPSVSAPVTASSNDEGWPSRVTADVSSVAQQGSLSSAIDSVISPSASVVGDSSSRKPAFDDVDGLDPVLAQSISASGKVRRTHNRSKSSVTSVQFAEFSITSDDNLMASLSALETAPPASGSTSSASSQGSTAHALVSLDAAHQTAAQNSARQGASERIAALLHGSPTQLPSTPPLTQETIYHEAGSLARVLGTYGLEDQPFQWNEFADRMVLFARGAASSSCLDPPAQRASVEVLSAAWRFTTEQSTPEKLLESTAALSSALSRLVDLCDPALLASDAAQSSGAGSAAASPSRPRLHVQMSEVHDPPSHVAHKSPGARNSPTPRRNAGAIVKTRSPLNEPVFSCDPPASAAPAAATTTSTTVAVASWSTSSSLSHPPQAARGKVKSEHIKKSPTLAHSLSFVASLSETRISLKHFDEKKFAAIVNLILEHIIAICRASEAVVGAKLAVAAENVATRLAKLILVCQEIREKTRKRGVLTEQRRFAVAFLELLTQLENVFSGGHVSCTLCAERLDPEYALAGGMIYHQRCVQCCVCARALNEFYYVVGDRLLCKEHSDVRGRLVCAACDHIIEDTFSCALSLYFHPDHLRCGHCCKPIAEQFVEQDGVFFCSMSHAKLAKSS